MKSKLIHGIIKDLMKMPLSKEGGPVHGKTTITIAEGDPEKITPAMHEAIETPEEEAMEEKLGLTEGIEDHDPKHLKTIAAKRMKGM